MDEERTENSICWLETPDREGRWCHRGPTRHIWLLLNHLLVYLFTFANFHLTPLLCLGLPDRLCVSVNNLLKRGGLGENLNGKLSAMVFTFQVTVYDSEVWHWKQFPVLNANILYLKEWLNEWWQFIPLILRAKFTLPTRRPLVWLAPTSATQLMLRPLPPPSGCPRNSQTHKDRHGSF